MNFEQFLRQSPYGPFLEAIRKEIAIRQAWMDHIRRLASAAPSGRRAPQPRRSQPAVGPAPPLLPPAQLKLSGDRPRSWLEDQFTANIIDEINSKPDTFVNEYGALIYRDAQGAIRMTPVRKGDEERVSLDTLPEGSQPLRMIHNHPGLGAVIVNRKSRKDDQGRALPPLSSRDLNQAVTNSGIQPSAEDFAYLDGINPGPKALPDQIIVGFDGVARRYDHQERLRLESERRNYWTRERANPTRGPH